MEDLFEKDVNLLTDSTKEIYNLFLDLRSKSDLKIDFVLDNVGLELVCDLCFIEMLYQTRLVDPRTSSIRFFVKRIPWFISDVTQFDFVYMLEHLYFNVFTENHQKEMVIAWGKLLQSGNWKLSNELFFTTPFEYYKMKRIRPQLYNDLAKSDLVIFKGKFIIILLQIFNHLLSYFLQQQKR